MSRQWHPSAPRYRTVDAAAIVDLLLLYGWAFEQRHEPARCHAEAGAALHRLIAHGLPATDHRFDPAEVINFAKFLGLRARDPLFADRFVPTGRRLHDDHPPRPSILTCRRTFDTSDVPAGQHLRLRLPYPSDTPAEPPHITADAPLTFATAPGQLTASGAATGQPTIAVTLRLAIAATLPNDRTPPDPAFTLAPRDGPIQVTPRIAALADRLAAGHTGRAAIDRFCDFMLDTLCCGIVHHDQAAVATDHVLETGWFDCYLGSALLAAFCRARGIASRLAGGILLSPTAPMPHHWMEAWLDDAGWIPFDLLAWDLSAGGQDPHWRRCLHGAPRLTTTILPRIFAGPGTIRPPVGHHRLPRPTATGIEMAYTTLTGQTVYSDLIAIGNGDGRNGAFSRPASPRSRTSGSRTG